MPIGRGLAWEPYPTSRRLVVWCAAWHLLPDAPRDGIVINLPEMRLYFFAEPGADPETFPIGIGREGWTTPTGTSRIVRKTEAPSWYPPESIRAERPELPAVVEPGEDNPLGSHALYLDWPAYLIHGTNRPWGIGRRISSGCIRLYPEDIIDLFARVPLNTPVTVVDQPVKLGWWDGRLYLEVHPTQAQADEFEESGSFAPQPIAGLAHQIRAAAGDRADAIDWDTVGRATTARDGVPTPITRQ